MKRYITWKWGVLAGLMLVLLCLPGAGVYAQIQGNVAHEQEPNSPMVPVYGNLPVEGDLDEDDLEELAEEQLVEGWAAPVTGDATSVAGNVSIAVDEDGNLLVVGDNVNNCIEIRSSGNGAGRIDGCEGTLVNAMASVALPNLFDDFAVNMLGGNDRVTVDYLDASIALDDLEFDTGSGDDIMTLRNVMLADGLHIDTGSGNDLIGFEKNTVIYDGADIDTGIGHDQVLFQVDPALGSLSLQGGLDLDTGADRDYVHICGVIFGDEVEVDLGSGDDSGVPGSMVGGLYVCNVNFSAHDFLEDVEFDGGLGIDGYVFEGITGITSPANVSALISEFELMGDSCADLGGSAELCAADR